MLVGVTLGANSAIAATPDAQEQPFKITVNIERTDDLGDTVYLGDRLTYTISYTNNTNEVLVAYPSESNLDGVLIKQGVRVNCRWSDLQPGATKYCTTPYHVVTSDDVASGFTPRVVFWATRDRNGKNAVQKDLEARDENEVTVLNETRPANAPDPATIPSNRAFTPRGLKLASPGQHGVACYRIPALAQAPNGWILVSYDLRPNDCSDIPQANSIVQRISKDGGKSFETQTVVAAGFDGPNKYGYSDPSYVVDEETGEIFLFFVKSYDVNVWGSQRGFDPNQRNVVHAAVVSSKDNGLTWSEPKIITEEVSKDTSWRSRFATSGAGIQMKYGKYKGRLVQQFSVINTAQNILKAVSVYSDDHGKTWKAGNPAGEYMDENKVVELSDGRLMMNSRVSDKNKFRKIAYSSDGGENWTNPVFDRNLPDPRNNAQITRAFPNAPEGSARAAVLLYSSSSGEDRRDGIIRISYDDGTTWHENPYLFKRGYMAYSVITALNSAAGGGYGLVFEGDSNAITYRRITLDMLDNADRSYADFTLTSPSLNVANGATSTDLVLNYFNSSLMNYKDAQVKVIAVTPSSQAPSETTLAQDMQATALATKSLGKIDAISAQRITIPNVPLPANANGSYNVTVVITGTRINEIGQEISTTGSTSPASANFGYSITLNNAITVHPEGTQPKPYITAELSRTDNLGNPVYLGEKVSYALKYTNNSLAELRVSTTNSNLDSLAQNCQLTIAPNSSATCPKVGEHYITNTDPETGFTATATFSVSDGIDTYQENTIVTTSDTLNILNKYRPGVADAATTPSDKAFTKSGLTLSTRGQDDVSCYRIPAIAQAPNGWILAAYDARPNNCGDAPQANSIVQRISKDGGESFETRTVVAGGYLGPNKYGYSDPSYVVDEETGEIFMFFVKSYDTNLWDSQEGFDVNQRGVMHAAVVSSKDNGLTWSEPRIITQDISNSTTWRSRFATSGAGIQLKYGDHKGRLIQQYAVVTGAARDLQAVSVYSDDHGKTWKAGNPVGTRMDENKVVELSDGRLMMNSRSMDVLARKVAYSEDGGVNWSEPVVDNNLPDPRNNAHITRAYPNAPEGSARAKVLLYSSSSPTGRSNGLIRISYDDGKTWGSAPYLFKEGAMAYSVITALDNKAGNGYGLLFEGDNHNITYRRITLDLLDTPENRKAFVVDTNGETSTTPTPKPDIEIASPITDITQVQPSHTTKYGSDKATVHLSITNNRLLHFNNIRIEVLGLARTGETMVEATEPLVVHDFSDKERLEALTNKQLAISNVALAEKLPSGAYTARIRFTGVATNEVNDEIRVTSTNNSERASDSSYTYTADVENALVVTPAENEWTTQPSIKNWKEGEDPANPTGAAKYGDIEYTYKKADESTYSAEKPSEIGSYVLKATVNATENYTGLTSETRFQILAAQEKDKNED
ncbi:MAG: sialidase family protein, partial [Bifidobacteriaceae bacterium]|nr:sialidase family protein [Bifidobacteriaceae bacterium]